MRLVQNHPRPTYTQSQPVAGSALLVDPDQHILADRSHLLMRYCEAVHALTTCGAVYDLQPQKAPFIAVLSDALGAFHLQAVTEYIRHRWAHTRIIIVGDAAVPHIEDQLYDEFVREPASDKDLLLAIERCRTFMF